MTFLKNFKTGLWKKELRWNTFPASTLTKGNSAECLTEEHVILWTPQITKEMVVEAAKAGKAVCS